ncbi:MAG: hypothetical protein FWC58_03005, partial [Desulfobulbus sp.]|nr:hypothetical protein [Desulfobulbus sp.]
MTAMPLFLSIGPDGAVNGLGSDPTVFVRSFLAPPEFDPARHLATARLIGDAGNEQLLLTGVPSVVTARQGRLALLEAGLLDGIEAAIREMPRAAQITFEYATEFARDWPLLLAVAEAANLSDEDVDNLFIRAATL